MLRRPPTRLELKLDDIQEYEQMRKKQRQFAASPGAAEDNGAANDTQVTAAQQTKTVHERIGYDPAQKK